MAAKINTTPPRGTRDVLPDEVELRDVATQRIVAVYRSYGFRRIETPALESLALLSGSDGGENEKLIFKILKRGEDLEAALRAGSRDLADFGLRFDLTVPLARYYAEGEESGFFVTFDKLDKVGAEGVLAELRETGREPRAIERFERLLPALQKGGVSLEALGSALDAGDEPAFAWLATISAGVAGALPSGARVQFDPTLVRGMGYYTGTIFEVVMPGFSGSVAGGGRYDRMVGKLLGRDVPACGFSIGFERLVAILGERGGAIDAG